jgi:hypothetical protein
MRRPRPHRKAAFQAKFEAASLSHAVLHKTSNGRAEVVQYDPPAWELLRGHAPALLVKASISQAEGSSEIGTANKLMSKESNYPGLLDADPGPAIPYLALSGAQVQPAFRQDAVRAKMAQSTKGRAARALHAQRCRARGPDYVDMSQVVKDDFLINSGCRQDEANWLLDSGGARGRIREEDESDLLPVTDLAWLRSMLNAGLPTIAQGLHIVNPAELQLD